MRWYDWVILVVPVIFVLGIGIYTRRYLKDVTAFLSAGRVCGRYVISVGDIANAISIIGLLSYVEIHYKTGFALSFWSSVTLPIGVLLGLYGYCIYRFRETKSQTIGQFFELRYSRKFRVFAAGLRSLSEMLANMIMPALAARFFMYFLDLPHHFTVAGFNISTFQIIMAVVLVTAISIICMGGSMAIIVTDTIQGFICYPLMALFVAFMLYKFSWGSEILPVLSARAEGENFLNPYDLHQLRDFNYFSMIVGVVALFMHRASWIGAGGSSSAGKSPHEQKMAALLGVWKTSFYLILYVLLAISLLAFMNHAKFEAQAHRIRLKLTEQIATDIVKDAPLRQQVLDKMREMPPTSFHPGVDAPLSEKSNVDTRYLASVRAGLNTGAVEENQGQRNSLFQQFRTLYYQQMLPVTLRNMLPAGMLGLFCLLMVLAMISTDDSRIFSATITISQDVILPFIKRELTPRQHMWILRVVAICIGVFFYLGSSFMAQLDYIQLYVTLTCTMWLGGCGPVIVFGLYSRFGTTKGAWASLVNGMSMAVIGALVQRNWADHVYPWLARHGLVDAVGNALEAFSAPFNPIVVWKMDAVKCPINSYEWYFITMIVSLILYFVVSLLTIKEPFNLERMLHRGKYSLDGERIITSVWTWKNLYNKLIGITPEYTFWDKVIAWCYFCYSICYRFLGTFLLVVIWNAFSPWPMVWWGNYFLVVFLIVPGVMAAITAVWFGICGTIDLRAMFRALEARVANPLDNGRVEGNMSLADKAQLEAVDREKQSAGGSR